MGARKEPIWRRYLRFFGPDVNADVDEELRFHLAMREQHYLERGLPPEEARNSIEVCIAAVEAHKTNSRIELQSV